MSVNAMLPILSRMLTPKVFRRAWLLSHTKCLSSLTSDHRSFSTAEQKSHLIQSKASVSTQGLMAQGGFLPRRTMAGHSKWQNIKHIKAAKDAQKSLLAAKIATKIKAAVREGGGNLDPKLNSSLARVLEEGKRGNVPESTMMNSIKSLKKSQSEGSILHIEGKAIGGCMFIIEVFTDKAKATKNNIQSVLKKYNGTLADSRHAFELKGIIHVPVMEGKAQTLDEAEEVAIEVGAEEVIKTTGDDDSNIFQFTCDPKSLHAVRCALEEQEYNILHAKQEYVAHTHMTLGGDLLNIAFKLCQALEELDEVVRVYDNIKGEEET